MKHHKHHHKNISRRSFLGQASCAAVGSTAFLSTALNLGLINTAAARPHIIGSSDNYKAIVCILLAGGADTFNVLVPTESSEYNDYAITRSSLALSNDFSLGELLPLNYSDAGRTFAVHGGMSRVRDMFDGGNLSFVSNIGTLIEPVANRIEYESGLKKLPLGLYSHSDQIMQWQTSVPQDRSAFGVGGRMADILGDMNSLPQVSMNISLDGKNRFQAGQQTLEYSINDNSTPDNIGIEGLPSWYSNSGFLNQTRDQTVDSMVEDVYSNIFQKTYSSLTRQSKDSIELFSSALAKGSPLNTTFSDTGLSRDLNMMAKVINVQQHLGANRQIFFTTFGGWDHHDDVLARQGGMLPVLSNALGEFNDSLIEMGLQDKVTTFTISDFARTLTSNGNGSDHAWGGNQMIMGGAVNGGQIYGNYPSLNLGESNQLNLNSRGRILPTTSVDEFYAEIALWFGVSPNDLGYILPNLCNFYSPTCPSNVPSDYAPIGMFENF